MSAMFQRAPRRLRSTGSAPTLLFLTIAVLAGIAGCGGETTSTVDPGIPARITDLDVVAGTGTSATLAWTAPGVATKADGTLRYDLRYIRLGQEATDRALWTAASAPVALVAAGQRQQHVVTGLTTGHTYVFSLSASYDGADWSAPSTFAVGTADAQHDQTPPARPVDLVQHAGDATSITVAWTVSGDDTVYGRAASYEVRYAIGPLDESTWADATPVTATTGAHPNTAKLTVRLDQLTPGQTILIGVKAVDDAGNRSALSNLVTARPGAMRTLYVKVDRSGDYPTIEAAVHAAQPGDVVLVGPGRYRWTEQGTGDTTLTLITVLRDQTDFTIRGEGGAEVTILDAEMRGRIMLVLGGGSGSGDDRVWAGVTIEGFTFVNGRALGETGVPGEPWGGAGVALHLTDTVVRDCVFRGNQSTEGGAVWLGGQGAGLVENCLIENNRAELGGGVMLINSEPVMTIRDCEIRGNLATVAGGGLFAVHVGAILENLLVHGNTSEFKGGGVSLSALHPGSRLEGCTIVDNAGAIGSALRLAAGMTVELRRCLLAFNRGGQAFDADADCSLSVGCGLVYGNTGGNVPPPSTTDQGGNLTADPLLCADGLHPSAASPCLPANRAGGDECGLIGALEAGCGG